MLRKGQALIGAKPGAVRALTQGAQLRLELNLKQARLGGCLGLVVREALERGAFTLFALYSHHDHSRNQPTTRISSSKSSDLQLKSRHRKKQQMQPKSNKEYQSQSKTRLCCA